MKIQVLGLFAALALCASLTGTTAAESAESYHVQLGDTLWDISEQELGSPWCWPLIASIPENNLDFQGYLYAGDTITLPTHEECEAIIHPVKASVPQVDESVLAYLPDQPWHDQYHLIDYYIKNNFTDVEPLHSYSKYDDMKIRDQSLYRERAGDTWYVVSQGERGQAWDYVDHVLRNEATGSVFYRARDLRGEWYIVKNEQATKLSFEPQGVYLDTLGDEVFVYRADTEKTYIYSTLGEWTIPVKAQPVAIDAQSRVLFRSYTTIDVRTKNADGSLLEVCSSSICDLDRTYWLNGVQVAATSARMVPLFSEYSVEAKPAFYYEGDEQAFNYYGDFATPTFDDHGNLVLYIMNGPILSTQTFDVSSVK